MKRESIIKLATGITWTVFIVSIALMIALVVLIVHWHIHPQFYNDWYLQNAFQAGLDSLHVRISRVDSSGISIGSLSAGMMWWLILRTSLILILMWIIILHVLRVLKSVASLQSFYEGNIRSFRMMAGVGLLVSAIAFFNFHDINNAMQWNFTIPFGPLVFSSFCLVLSEIFKEGKFLLEDSKSIV